MSRTNITQKIHRICTMSGVPEEKGNPRCLKKLYQTTRAGIEANFDLLVEQAMERQMEAEQESIGWKETDELSVKADYNKTLSRKRIYAAVPDDFGSKL